MSGVSEGMDPARLREIAEQLRANAERLDGVHGRGKAQLTTLLGVWSGPDLETFQRSWDASGARLEEASGLLRAAVEDLFAQADAQVEASGGEGGGGRGFGLPDFDFPDIDFPDFDWDWPDVDWPDVSMDLSGAWEGFLDMLEAIGDWWDDLPWWGQILLGLAAVAVVVVIAIFAGAALATIAAVAAAAAAVVGVIMTVLDLANELAEIFGDPAAAWQKFLDDPAAFIDELIWVVVGALPYGIGKLFQRFRKPISEFIEGVAPWVKKKADEVADWFKRKWDELNGKPPVVGDGQVDEVLEGLPPGRSSGVRVVGSQEEFDELADRLTREATEVDPGSYPGRVYERPDGTIVRIRETSKSGGSTMDITLPSGEVVKVHIE